MTVTVADINAISVLTEWTLDNGHPAPIYNAHHNTVMVEGVDDAQLTEILENADSAAIASAKSRASIRVFQLMSPRPANASLAQSRAWAQGVSQKIIGHLRSAATGNADAVTLSGWVDKLALAQGVLGDDPNSDYIAILQAEADMRQLRETAEQLAQKVIVKATQLRTVRSKIDGFEDRITRQINAAADVPGFNTVISSLVTEGAAVISELAGE